MLLNWRVSWLYCLIATGTNQVMKFKQFTHYLLQHSYIAVLLTFSLSSIPILGSLAVIYAGLVTLRKGAFEGAIMTVAASIFYVLNFGIISPPPPTDAIKVWAVVGIAILINVLTYVTALLLERRMTWSSLLQVFSLGAVLVVSVVHLIYPDIANLWGAKLTDLANLVAVTTNVPMTDPQLQFIQFIKEFVNGILASVVLLCTFSQLAVSRWWEAYVFSPGLLRRELHNIRLSPLAGALFMLSLVFLWLGNSVIMDIMPILYLLFMVAGLSLIHYLLGTMVSPTRWFWLVLMYVVLIYTNSISVVILATIGLMDIWLDFRKKLRKV